MPVRLDGVRRDVGRSCRWVDGAVRQQCAVHLPFGRQATVNGGFPILPTGSTDPLPPLSLQEAVIQRLNSPNPCGFICTVGWSVGLDIALTFLDLQKAIAHIVR